MKRDLSLVVSEPIEGYQQSNLEHRLSIEFNCLRNELSKHTSLSILLTPKNNFNNILLRNETLPPSYKEVSFSD